MRVAHFLGVLAIWTHTLPEYLCALLVKVLQRDVAISLASCAALLLNQNVAMRDRLHRVEPVMNELQQA